MDLNDALTAFGFEKADLRPPAVQNGHGFLAVCFGCGEEFISARRPSPERHSWCEDCRQAGKPNAQRVKEFRQRRVERLG